MKKTFIIMSIFLSVVLFLNLKVYANSAPIYSNEPGQHGLIPMDDNTIDVIREDLVFDFRNNDIYYNSPIAEVTATYYMKNDTDETIRMAFPLLTNEMGLYHTGITVNDIKIEPEISYGPQSYYDDFNQMSVDEIFSSLYDDDYYELEFNPYGFLYTFSFENTNRIEIVVPRFNGSSYLVDGFTGYRWNTDHITFIAESDAIINKPKPTFYAIDFEPDIENNDYVKQGMFVNEYLDIISENIPYHSDSQLSMLKRTIDERADYLGDVLFIKNLVSEMYNERIVVLIYDVPLISNFENVVTVKYNMQGKTHNRYNPKVYEYEYFLLPASVYRSFKDLTITIYPNVNNPFVIESNLEFIKSDNVYQTYSANLPEENLSFKISRSEDPKESSGNFFNVLYISFIVLAALIPSAIVVSIVVVVVMLIKRKKKFNSKL